MIASTTNCCKSFATVAATVTAKKLRQQLQKVAATVAATAAATVAATITTDVARTVITYVQNKVDIFRKQTGVNVDPSGIGWV